MENKQNIIVKDATMRSLHKDGMDYICITDIARQKNGANRYYCLQKRYV